MHILSFYFAILRKNFRTQIFLLLILAVIFGFIIFITLRIVDKGRFLEAFYDISENDLYTRLLGDTPFTFLSEISNLPQLHRSALDNSLIPFKEDVFISVIIENHPKSRPQMKGLSKAGIVYEALAEGGITRFLAIFSYQNLSKIGPIRSARPYFVQLAQSYYGGFAHAGGSPQALSLISQIELVNLEGLYYEEISGRYFFRDTDYYAPHNLFADLVKLKPLVRDTNKVQTSILPLFNFLDENIKKDYTQDARQIIIDFSETEFKTVFAYNSELNKYLRYLGGIPHIDSTDNSQVAPSNVIVVKARHDLIDDDGRLDIGVIGKGKAFVFTRGQKFSAIWHKKNSLTSIRFNTEDDGEIYLSSGQTWIAIIDDEDKLLVN